MAASSSLKRLNPIRYVGVFVAINLIFLLIASYSLNSISFSERKRASELWLKALVLSNAELIEEKRYREFSEKVGKILPQIYISIQDQDDSFIVGSKGFKYICTSGKYSTSSVVLCQKPAESVLEFLWLILAYLSLCYFNTYFYFDVFVF